MVNTQKGDLIFSFPFWSSGFSDRNVSIIGSYIAMKGIPISPLSCLKWRDDGDLSDHDTAALVARLVSVEKSRRSLQDHHNHKLGKAAKPMIPSPLAI